jgi:hypothetical protein
VVRGPDDADLRLEKERSERMLLSYWASLLACVAVRETTAPTPPTAHSLIN